jgi:hypothetical protein
MEKCLGLFRQLNFYINNNGDSNQVWQDLIASKKCDSFYNLQEVRQFMIKNLDREILYKLQNQKQLTNKDTELLDILRRKNNTYLKDEINLCCIKSSAIIPKTLYDHLSLSNTIIGLLIVDRSFDIFRKLFKK